MKYRIEVPVVLSGGMVEWKKVVSEWRGNFDLSVSVGLGM